MQANSRMSPNNANGQAMSYEEFFRELFATPEKPLILGPRPGLEPPALPSMFRRVRGGDQLVSYELLVAEDGRIAAKHENVAGSETYFIYEYDDAGHLLRAWRDGRLAEEYAYDGRGARVASWNEKNGQWTYGYDAKGRLASAGPWQFSYAADGSLREAWTPQTAFFLSYDRAGGMSRVVLPRNRVLRCETMPPGLPPGLPVEKYVDARPVESLTWRSPLKLATYRDRDRNVQMRFHYTGKGRLPQAVTVQTAQGQANYLLGYDQVGSLKAVAAMDGPNEGRVVKTIDYDSFGNVLTDSNPGLFLPLAFAGGLRDRFTGLVRFCHRDYDPSVGRFTAPDPLGAAGGDHDLYEYCVDEPVGRVDPEGLKGEGVADSGGFLSGIGEWFGSIGKKIGEMYSPGEAQATTGSEMPGSAVEVGSAASGVANQGLRTTEFRESDVGKSVLQTLPQRNDYDLLQGDTRPKFTLLAANDGAAGAGASSRGDTDSAGDSGAQQGNSQTPRTNRDTRTPPPAESTQDKMERQGRGLPEPEVDDGEPLSKAEKDYLRQYYPDVDLDKVKIRRRVPGIFGDASGATTGNTIYMDPSVYPPNPESDEQLEVLPEELAHSAQQKNNPGFYFKYAGEYLWDRIKGKGHDEAYNNISYEKEAKAKAEKVGEQMKRDRAAGRLPWPNVPSK